MRSVEMVGGWLALSFKYSEGLVNDIRQIRGRVWDSKSKRWMVQMSELRFVLRLAEKWGFSLPEEIAPKPEPLNLGHPPSFESHLDMRLYGYQRHGVEFLKSNERAILAWSPGTGKSATALVALRQLDIFPAIIICPASLRNNWKAEAKTWAPEKKVQILKKGADKADPYADIVVTSYSLAAKSGFLPSVVIADESHALKTPTSKRTRAVRGLVRRASPEHVWLLSGTPSPNGRPMEILAQLEVLGVVREMFGSFAQFAERYCERTLKKAPTGVSYWDDRGACNLDELARRIDPIFFRVTQEQVLPDLPGKERRVHYVDANLSEYQPLEEDYLAWRRLNQNAEFEQVMGWIARMRSCLGRSKIEPALTFVASFVEAKVPVVVFAHHRVVVETIAKHFGAPSIHGDTSMKERNKIVKAFQAGKHGVLVGNLAAMGEGLTLTRAHHVVVVELPYVPGVLDQAEDRCSRIGQSKRVQSHLLIVKDSIDEKILDALSRKRSVNASIMKE